MEEVRIRDARRLLDLAYELGAASDADELRAGIAAGLSALIGATLTSFTEVGVANGYVNATCDPPGEDLGDIESELGRLARQHPLIGRAPARAATAETLSDYLPQRVFHATELYVSVYRELEAEDQLAINLPAARGTVIGVALNRPRRTFTGRDRALLELIRPLLARACAKVGARECAARAATSLARAEDETLSPRQREVLDLVRLGYTNREIALELTISHRTVENHLHAVYRKLRVPNRTTAVASA